MAYNPALYNPYGQQVQVTMQPTPTMQPTTMQQTYSGIVSIDNLQEAERYPVAPNSSSPALFLKNENKFLVKIVDQTGNVSIKHYKFEDVTPDPMAAYVTKDDFKAFMDEIKEAINEQHTSAKLTGQYPATGQTDSVHRTDAIS